MTIEDKKIKISVIVEDKNIQDYIVLMLIGENYEVRAYSWQGEALSELEKDIPDLVISDSQSTNIDSVYICKAVRKNFLFSQTPFIFILKDSAHLEKAKLIYAGADDYIQTSSIKAEFLLRVKLALYRASRQQDINPVSRLPGQASLLKELQKRIDSKTLFAVSYLDLYKFREFDQRYGFKKGDEVIKYAASLIIRSLRNSGSPSDFLSHPRGDDFFFITSPRGVETIADKIIKDFDEGISEFYDDEDRKRGAVFIKNRKGDILEIPILRIYIGVVTNEHYSFINPAQIIQIAVELKNFAQKNFEKSMYVKERRKECPSP